MRTIQEVITMSLSKLVPVLLVVGSGACADSDDAALDRSQILAVRTDPAHVPAGTKARVDILAGDERGNVFETMPDKLESAGLAVEQTSEGWFVTAPMPSATTPRLAMLALAVTIDGSEWRATKQLIVAADGTPRANPTVTAMQVDGSPASGELVVQEGEKPALSALGDGDELEYAWYTSIGALSRYRQPEAILDANETGEGVVVVVVRDGVGGAGWQILPARIE